MAPGWSQQMGSTTIEIFIIPNQTLNVFSPVLSKILVNNGFMPNKRNIDNLYGSESPPGKRCHVSTPDMKNEVFLVFTVDRVIGIFWDKNETKQYTNDKQTRVIAFKNVEDAAQCAKEVEYEVTQMRNAQRETASLLTDGVSAENTTEKDIATITLSVTEPVPAISKDRDLIDMQEASVPEDNELPIAKVTQSSDHVTVFASSTTAKSKGHSARMSYGIYFGEGSPYNFSGVVVGRASTQRAEMIAALEAIKATIRRNLVTSNGRIELCISSSVSLPQSFSSSSLVSNAVLACKCF